MALDALARETEREVIIFVAFSPSDLDGFETEQLPLGGSMANNAAERKVAVFNHCQTGREGKGERKKRRKREKRDSNFRRKWRAFSKRKKRSY